MNFEDKKLQNFGQKYGCKILMYSYKLMLTTFISDFQENSKIVSIKFLIQLYAVLLYLIYLPKICIFDEG